VTLILYGDLEDLTSLELSGMTLPLGIVTTAKTTEEPLINPVPRFSSAVKMCPEKFQAEGLMRVGKAFLVV